MSHERFFLAKFTISWPQKNLLLLLWFNLCFFTAKRKKYYARMLINSLLVHFLCPQPPEGNKKRRTFHFAASQIISKQTAILGVPDYCLLAECINI